MDFVGAEDVEQQVTKICKTLFPLKFPLGAKKKKKTWSKKIIVAIIVAVLIVRVIFIIILMISIIVMKDSSFWETVFFQSVFKPVRRVEYCDVPKSLQILDTKYKIDFLEFSLI